MKKKEAVKITLEQLDLEARQAQEEKEREEREKQKNEARPSLIQSMGVGLLDFVFTAIIVATCALFSYFVLFEPLGYNAAAETIVNEYKQSGLFLIEDSNFISIDTKYDDKDDPVAYYDTVITHYYATDSRAISENKLTYYIQTKVDSGYFVIDSENNCVVKEGIGTLVLKELLEKEYANALEYFYESPILAKASKTTFDVIGYTLLISVSIGAVIIYIIIPLCSKNKQTFAYRICGLTTVNSKTLQPLTTGKIILRNSIFIVITYVLAVTLFLLSGEIYYSAIPVLANTILMCLFHTNCGIHDIGAECTVINVSRSNAMANLQAIKEMGEQQ